MIVLEWFLWVCISIVWTLPLLANCCPSCRGVGLLFHIACLLFYILHYGHLLPSFWCLSSIFPHRCILRKNWAVRTRARTRLDSSSLVNKQVVCTVQFTSYFFPLVEGNLVKATNQCRLENMKKLRELSFFLELSNIGDNFFHISLDLLLGLL